jgi:hypothetical protein
MMRIMRLSSLFFVLVAIGCASVGRTPVSVPSAAPDVPAISAAEAVGVWSLADDENCTFDVRVCASGTAVSNWSKGPASAAGEQGRWIVSDDRIVIDYTDGWRDCIIRTAEGSFRKESFGPGAPRDGVPTNRGLAVRTPAAAAAWVGVYRQGDSSAPGSLHVAIQSTGIAHKSEGRLRTGAWWIEDGAMRIRWADGSTEHWSTGAQGGHGRFVRRLWSARSTLDAQGSPVSAPTILSPLHRID